MARSLFTATVIPGGLKEACDTQLARQAPEASPSRALSTHSAPTTRPSARAELGAPSSASLSLAAETFSLRLRALRISWARSVPLSSHSCAAGRGWAGGQGAGLEGWARVGVGGAGGWVVARR